MADECGMNTLYTQLDDERKCLISLDKELCYQKSRVRDCEDILVLLQNEIECKNRQFNDVDNVKVDLVKATQCLRSENQKLMKLLAVLTADLNNLLRLASAMAEKANVGDRCKTRF
ncbi:hypothetical protein HELRODRAFT_169760 [Helobdella robusta]|uniref:Uncharacterized protein n=1 Tax=Helobdella robusta TaxID=6412 RepID=T1F2B0_HELRO|nr:hypothetical protein HELRODRAFT_169760 [Helobdella robusta]ESO08036.1 hypothetical protein HELRODRAFT_169760 [Helobdella robusta]